ncbi:MAG: hypothetical protein SA378_10405 [Sedimentibacter sp.]|uniref:hypothetical protein n=1 Tax=Sedimentibacter sp. TaxID=1960295 RepID=UPI002981E576|nr:hypothetical protein [Sedimentibacter sp.]MDW5300531.1 hypothetical protein [Sedimentibacter sp.]
MKTDLTVDDVKAYYEAALQHIYDLEVIEMGGMVAFNGESDGYQISVLATKNQMGGTENTMVQIIFIPAE